MEVMRETTKDYKDRDWYRETWKGSLQAKDGWAKIDVEGKRIYEYTDNEERNCNELPLDIIMNEAEKAGRLHSGVIGGEQLVGWQGCLISRNRDNGEPSTVIDVAKKRERVEGSGTRRLIPAYTLLRNQIVLHTASVANSDFYVSVKNIFNPPLAPNTGARLDYVDQQLGTNLLVAAARDSANRSWGGFDIVHLIQFGESGTSAMLQVARNGLKQPTQLFWLKEGHGVYHGRNVVGNANVVNCIPNFKSVFVANSVQAEMCIEIRQETESGSGCFGSSAESGTYRRYCIDSPTNGLDDIGGGLQKWDAEIGRTDEIAAYGSFSAHESMMGEILLILGSDP
ncbi:unnamed protein product [Cylindrotheca closterium]|uniref:Uncharacterized protein n=1 Tax=Cylindrotheca closterium TaxID=2856 RepID=A0AAD2G335_9STRA|nr:unnamed protein product [Cylindrotheca closterium]